MNFDFPGYSLNFIQKRPCSDSSEHLFTLIFTFHSPVTKLKYVALAEFHNEDVFGVKFYAKKDKKSDFKYNKIINRGDVGNIILTMINLIILLWEKYPSSSFFYNAAGSIDRQSNRIEGIEKTQRFTVYNYVIEKKIGTINFEHFSNEKISGYLLVNRNCGLSVDSKKEKIIEMLQRTYKQLAEI